MNTNIQAAFDLILNTAVKGKVSSDEMPRMLFIISDMEFDSHYVGGNTTNFDVIKRKYAKAGYVMPTLVFWNVSSRNDQTPVTENEQGVFLVSGASAGIFKSAINAKATNPMELMLETLNDTRYDAISEALSK
jgi:Na+-transporting methylmalonyl-CoA/oxaloacetate decarboxylase beta subunit